MDSSISSHARHAGLDALRGLAILGVLIGHSNLYPQFQWASVLLFFVLSGYLITNILFYNLNKPFLDYWSHFLIRRTLRIFPAYYMLIAVAWFYLAQHEASTKSMGWQIFYVQNYMMLLPNWDGPAWLSHTWSLAVEEQFYLLWPFAVWFLGRRHIPTLCALLMIIGIIWRAYPYGRPFMEAHFHTLAVIDCLAWGAIIACMREKPFAIHPALRTAVWGIVIATALMLIVDLRSFNDLVIKYALDPANPYLVTMLGGFFALIVAICIDSPPRILNNPVLRHLGVISYGLYLWHYPIMHWTSQLKTDNLYLVILEFGLSYLAALASWYLMEKHVLKLKDRFQ